MFEHQTSGTQKKLQNFEELKPIWKA